MRTLPAGLQAHLDSGATTLCWCWRITRADGLRFGFTDHDQDVAFDGTVFEAASGFSATEVEGSVGLNVDNLDVEGALRSDRLNDEDLAAGLFDDAEIEIYRVNWADPQQNLLMRLGNLGEVSRGPRAFSAEVRGLAHKLQQPSGRLFQYGCDADLGDAHCKLLLQQPAFKGSGTVATLISQSVFLVSGIDAFAADWFTRGLLTWTGGANAGRAIEVKSHAASATEVRIEIWRKMSKPVAAADSFEVTAGCDKQFATCRDKFANQVNFRGFPHMPGNDFAVSYPNSDDAANDGGALIG
jgi:uncharacterized phage protein (TIGR02218 family)